MPKHFSAFKKDVTAKRENKRYLRFAHAASLLVVLVFVFCLGFILRGNDKLMNSLGFLPISGQAVNTNPATNASNPYELLSPRVAEVETLLNTDSLDSYDLTQLTSTVLNAMTSGIDDPYLTYFDENRYRNYVSDAAASTNAGVGVLFAENEGSVYAVDVFEGGPAAAVGVLAGDIVVSIGGTSVQGWTATEVANALSAEEGEELVVAWRRSDANRTNTEDGSAEEFTTAIHCSAAQEVNVKTELIDSVGYISITQFTQNSADLVSEAVSSLAERGARAYVLDIRNCPGGYLSQAVDTTSLFLASGTIVQIESATETSTKSVTGSATIDAPLVVLINENTTAAAEVLAAALKDTQRAELVGTTTRGKGSVQVVRELSFGGALRYTAARYISPSGHSIDGLGVSPTVHVALSDGYDNQKSVAIEMASSQINS